MGNLDFNYTVLIQLANFLITLVVLNYLLIKPVRDQLQKRKSLTDGYINDIGHFTALAEEKISSYESALDLARAEAAKTRDDLKLEGRGQEHNLVATAQADAQRYLKESRESVAAQMQEARAALSKEVPAFAKEAVSRILA